MSLNQTLGLKTWKGLAILGYTQQAATPNGQGLLIRRFCDVSKVWKALCFEKQWQQQQQKSLKKTKQNKTKTTGRVRLMGIYLH